MKSKVSLLVLLAVLCSCGRVSRQASEIASAQTPVEGFMASSPSQGAAVTAVRLRVTNGNSDGNGPCAVWSYEVRSTQGSVKLIRGLSLDSPASRPDDRARQVDDKTVLVRSITTKGRDGVLVDVQGTTSVKIEGVAQNCFNFAKRRSFSITVRTNGSIRKQESIIYDNKRIMYEF